MNKKNTGHNGCQCDSSLAQKFGNAGIPSVLILQKEKSRNSTLPFKRIITFELVLDLLERNDEGSDKLHDFLSIDIAGGMHSS